MCPRPRPNRVNAEFWINSMKQMIFQDKLADVRSKVEVLKFNWNLPDSAALHQIGLNITLGRHFHFRSWSLLLSVAVCFVFKKCWPSLFLVFICLALMELLWFGSFKGSPFLKCVGSMGNGHGQNSFRSPSLSKGPTWKKSAPNHPSKPLYPQANVGKKCPKPSWQAILKGLP